MIQPVHAVGSGCGGLFPLSCDLRFRLACALTFRTLYGSWFFPPPIATSAGEAASQRPITQPVPASAVPPSGGEDSFEWAPWSGESPRPIATRWWPSDDLPPILPPATPSMTVPVPSGLLVLHQAAGGRLELWA